MYPEIRDAVCSRLTIYAGRRGGEPARLYLYQWEEALRGDWLRPEKRANYKETIQTVARITYQEGKGDKLVSVFIPPDVVAACEFLASNEIRAHCRVHEKNPYLFPSTQNSQNHVSGWHAISNTCKKANIAMNVNGTLNRHRLASMFGGMEMSQDDRQMIFDHFGHSKDINTHVYQIPQAERLLASTGKYLQIVDTQLSNPGKY